jgi:cell division protein FtsB
MNETVEISLQKEKSRRKKKYFLLSSVPLLAGLIWLALSLYAIKNTTSNLTDKKQELSKKQLELDTTNTKLKMTQSQFYSLNDSISRAGIIYNRIKDSLKVKDSSLKIQSKKADSLAVIINSKAEQYKELEQDYAKKQSEITELQSQKNDLAEAIKELEDRKKTDSTQIVAFKNILQEKKIYQLNPVYVPFATATVTGRNKLGSNLYDYSVGINARKEELAKINSVVYYFNDPTFKRSSITMTDVKNKFTVKWNGWGCLNIMKITINLKTSKEPIEMVFNMCDAIKR